ncbi:MAG: rhomboid family intramembrane serine protease [Chitinophagaceae bacterium]|nr:rhomboid family intramembrane serine protease [Chitinophagaceae bacterium]
MTEIRPGRFEIVPLVIKNLLIINGLVFLAQVVLSNNSSFSIENYFALHDVRSVYFKPHQLVSYLFLHGGFEHLLMNMFALWIFGSKLENYWGAKRFLIFYTLCGIGAGLLHLGVLYFEQMPIAELVKTLPIAEQEELLYNPRYKLNIPTVGASGSVFGCLFAFGYLFPNTTVWVPLLMLPIPIRAKWLVIIYGAMELYLGVKNSAGDNIAHWAHLGGALIGFLLVFYWNKTNRRTFY